jgi:penicillin amidase
MKKTLRVLGWSLAAVSLLILVSAGGLYLWLRTSLPTTSGVIQVAGLNAAVNIARDRDGLVHITAPDRGSAYFALGYVHAQDRLWQMEAIRRLGMGRLSEIVGARFIPQDRLMRTLGIYPLAKAGLKQLSPEARRVVDDYTRGVNAWIENHRGALPPEFALFLYQPEPWQPADSLIWGRIMALSLSGSWRRELTRMQMRARLAPGMIERLYPPPPADSPVTVPAPLKTAAKPDRAIANPISPQAIAALLEALPPAPPATGASNSWVMAGHHTTSGKPILVNDPHLSFRAPNIWYLARLSLPGLTLAGATAPGVPFHVLGHNGQIAWGMTTTGADTLDLVVEKLSPGNHALYQTPDGPRPFATRLEIIRVRSGADIRLTIRESHNGPVISDLSRAAADAAGPGAVLVLRAPMLRPDDATAEALYQINKATGWQDFTKAIELFHSPVQNLSYADTKGRIGFSVAGRIPRRKPGTTSSTNGDDGFIAAANLPRLLNPDHGLIINANNRVVGPGYPYVIARSWEAPYRAQRVEKLLATPGPTDIAKSRAILLDAVSLPARELLPILRRLTVPGTDHQAALDLLAAWDGTADRHRPEALIFAAWGQAIMAAIFTDELGSLAGRFVLLRPVLLRRVLEQDTGWCDNTATPGQVETCPQIVTAALQTALADLRTRYSPDIGAWRWGAAHRAVFRNPALDWLPLVGKISRIAIATDGDNFTINRGTFRGRGRGGPFRHGHGATLRAIYDLANLDASLFSMPGGQSGNPLSPHYRDLTQRWRDGDFLRLAPNLQPQGQGGSLLRLEPFAAGAPRGY